MPGPIHRRENLANQPRRWLATMLLHGNDRSDQKLFNHAIELIRRRNKTTNQEIAARVTLRRLAQSGRTWTNRPSSNRFTGNNYESNANLNSNSNSNNGTNNIARAQQRFRAAHAPAAGFGTSPTFNNRAPPAARAPNYSKASGAVKKWLAARPHTVHQNVVKIKLPANATDPVSYNNFKSGNEAVMVIKKRLQQNGATRSKRTFYTKKSIGGLAATHRRIAAPHTNPVPWRTILRMKGSDVVFKDPINRRAVYRRDLMNVKFMA